jgi:hypothetical protein
MAPLSGYEGVARDEMEHASACLERRARSRQGDRCYQFVVKMWWKTVSVPHE